MPTSCSVYGCSNRFSKEKKIQFFTFPFKNKDRLEAWITAVHRKDWKPSKASRICSAHFKPQDFLHRPGTALYPYIRRLKHDAIPSVFSNYPESLELNESELEKEKFPTSVINLPECSNEPGQSFQDPLVYPNKLKELKLKPKDIEKLLEVDDTGSQKDFVIDRLQRQILTLKQQVNRKDKSIEYLKDLISHLQKKDLYKYRWCNGLYYFSRKASARLFAAQKN